MDGHIARGEGKGKFHWDGHISNKDYEGTSKTFCCSGTEFKRYFPSFGRRAKFI